MISKEYNTYFLITGKALYIAIEFESDINILATYLSIKEDPIVLKNEKAIEEFCNKILILDRKRGGPKRRLRGIFGGAFQEIFEGALESRNYIAHEITLGLEHLQPDEFSIQEFIKMEIEPHTLNILKADFILKSLISNYVNKEEFILTDKWVNDYLKWTIQYL